MATYLIFTKLGTESYESPKQFRELAEKVAARIRAECPAVQWKDSYAVMGRFDVVDVVEAASAGGVERGAVVGAARGRCDVGGGVGAASAADVERAAMIVRAEAHATTETMHATPWKEFLQG